jgi:SAM-dependent methyltransferase
LQILFILGRNPVISIAEIRAKFLNAKICAREQEFAIFENIDSVNLQTIGGTIKVGEVFAREMNYVQHDLKNKDAQQIYEFLAQELTNSSKGKKNFGISIYPFESRTLKTLLIGAKKFLKAKGINARFANKNFTNLTNPQSEFEVLKNGGVEILVTHGGNNWFFAKLKQNQPFDSYRKRDYEKAYRDARVGMLPPKLAQMMINLGVGGLEKFSISNFQFSNKSEKINFKHQNSKEDRNDDFFIDNEIKKNKKKKEQANQPPVASHQSLSTIYDPFCGAGGIMIEAGLMGYKTFGSDIDERMVEFSRKNLEALSLNGKVFIHDAKKKLSESDWEKYDVVVSEGYLGPPRKTMPDLPMRQKIFAELKELYRNFFSLVECGRVVICFPVYLEKGQPKFFASAEILPVLRFMGWEMKNTEKLIYARKNQIVGREIVVLERRMKNVERRNVLQK